MEERIKIDCPKCKYSWGTKSKMHHVSCPKCGKKIKILENIEADGTRRSNKID